MRRRRAGAIASIAIAALLIACEIETEIEPSGGPHDHCRR